MSALLRKYGLFYLAHTVTFFFLCAYSLVAEAPNFPFLPAMFMPIYLCAAVALSERESGDPLLDVLPITPREIMTVKFHLAFALVAVGWVNMTVFTLLQGLPESLAYSVHKLNLLATVWTLALAAGLQLGLHYFGWSNFRKVIIGLTVVTSLFSIAFFVGLAESGRDYVGGFPLVPALESTPAGVVGLVGAVGVVAYYLVLSKGPWRSHQPLAA